MTLPAIDILRANQANSCLIRMGGRPHDKRLRSRRQSTTALCDGRAGRSEAGLTAISPIELLNASFDRLEAALRVRDLRGVRRELRFLLRLLRAAARVESRGRRPRSRHPDPPPRAGPPVEKRPPLRCGRAPPRGWRAGGLGWLSLVGTAGASTRAGRLFSPSRGVRWLVALSMCASGCGSSGGVLRTPAWASAARGQTYLGKS